MSQPAVCSLSVVPVRAEATDKAEIVTQLLFGELVTIIEIKKDKKNWCKIRCEWDSYEGWADPRQFKFITHQQAQNYSNDHAFCLDLMSTLINNDHFLPVTMGATLPCFDGFNVQLADKHYTFNGQVLLRGSSEPSADFILKIARRYLYAPYLWGGRSPFGIDCSGFTQIVYKMAGIRLRRDASQQVEQGKTIDFLELAQPADLAFFDNDKGNIIHVGIIMEGSSIIHASGQVRVDKLDHYGIYNEERGEYSHKLRIIKRYISDIQPTPIVEENLPEEKEPTNQINLF
jgi:hypothetical protein